MCWRPTQSTTPKMATVRPRPQLPPSCWCTCLLSRPSGAWWPFVRSTSRATSVLAWWVTHVWPAHWWFLLPPSVVAGLVVGGWLCTPDWLGSLLTPTTSLSTGPSGSWWVTLLTNSLLIPTASLSSRPGTWWVELSWLAHCWHPLPPSVADVVLGELSSLVCSLLLPSPTASHS